jgi:hypothetical protein
MTHRDIGYELNLLNKDIIHNPDDRSYKEFVDPEETYAIENFLSNDEIQIIKNLFNNNQTQHIDIKNKIQILQQPFRFKEFCDIITPKLTSLFPNSYRLTEFLPESTQSSDFIMYQTMIFPPHTDSIIHVPNYVPFKDLLIPLAVDDNITCPFYTCNQRFYGRASSLRYGTVDNVVAIYSNTVRFTTYQNYGIENIKDSDMTGAFYDNFLKNEIWPKSVWNGLTLNQLFDWIPGNMIVMDPSVIHGPTNYKLSGGQSKMGLTIRLFKYNCQYNPDPTFSIYS